MDAKLDDIREIFDELFPALGPFAKTADGEPPRKVGDRLVPMVIEPGYRGIVAEERTIAVRRGVRCACALRRKRCPRCQDVGWFVHDQTFRVRLPAGVSLGTKLRLQGKGDEIEQTGDLYVELVAPGERAETLRTWQVAEEAALDARQEERRAAMALGRRRARAKALQTAAFLSLPFAIIGVIWLAEHLGKRRVGEPCATSKDCRSSQCMAITRPQSPIGTSSLRLTETVGHVCTSTCTTIADCPEAMECAPVRERIAGLPFASNAPPDRLACVPR